MQHLHEVIQVKIDLMFQLCKLYITCNKVSFNKCVQKYSKCISNGAQYGF